MTTDIKKFRTALRQHDERHGYRLTVLETGHVHYVRESDMARAGQLIERLRRDAPRIPLTVDHIVWSEATDWSALGYARDTYKDIFVAPMDDDTMLDRFTNAYAALRRETVHRTLADAVDDGMRRYAQLGIPSYLLVDEKQETVYLTTYVPDLVAMSSKVRRLRGTPLDEPVPGVRTYKLDIENDRFEAMNFPYVLQKKSTSD